jgi:hypothetical protein
MKLAIEEAKKNSTHAKEIIHKALETLKELT